MKYALGILLFIPLCAIAVDFPSPNAPSTNSFLVPQVFPKTFNDLSFTERIEVLTEGYAPWESEYDKKTGKCISNCAYTGITIETELQALQRNTDIANAKLQAYLASNPTLQPTAPIAPTKPNTSTSSRPVNDYNCSVFNSSILPDQVMPLGEPLTGKPKITSPFGRRIHPITGNLQEHTGVDFAAPIGTNVYSTARGVVESVWADATCGKSIRVKHDNGFATLYCHLNEQLVKPGDTVGAGCLIARSGNTGRSTGPHLHYAIYSDGKFTNPNRFIGRQ